MHSSESQTNRTPTATHPGSNDTVPSPPVKARVWSFEPLLELFSSVRFGIVLLVLLFIYMAIGSAGLVYPVSVNIFSADAWVHRQIRQHRPLEMTEFEWFHWWPSTSS